MAEQKLPENWYRISWREIHVSGILNQTRGEIVEGKTPKEAYEKAFNLIKSCILRRIGGLLREKVLFLDYRIQLKDGKWYRFGSNELEEKIKE
jgi:hypothetical protein